MAFRNVAEVVELVRAIFDPAGDPMALLADGEVLDVPGTPEDMPRSPMRDIEVIADWGDDTHRIVELCGVTHTATGEGVLPVAVVSTVGSAPRRTHVYHSARLLVGERRPRRPVEGWGPPLDRTSLHPVLQRYYGALASRSPTRLRDAFAHDAVIDNGVQPVRDPELTAVLTTMAATGGPDTMMYTHVAAPDAVAVEYILEDAPRRGGFAVYRLDGDGRLAGIRTYDDFDPRALLGPRIHKT